MLPAVVSFLLTNYLANCCPACERHGNSATEQSGDRSYFEKRRITLQTLFYDPIAFQKHTPATIHPMPNDTITITLKLFAVYQETLGLPEKQLELSAGSTVGDVLTHIIATHPTLAQWQDLTRFGLNLKFVEAGTSLNNGDELVLIPPVSGG